MAQPNLLSNDQREKSNDEMKLRTKRTKANQKIGQTFLDDFKEGTSKFLSNPFPPSNFFFLLSAILAKNLLNEMISKKTIHVQLLYQRKY
jgi:hypothetical protein